MTRAVHTFSIAAFDPTTGELGVATESKFLAVGAVVPWARAGVGAIATQSWANTSFGSQGLDLLASGLEPQQVLDQLLADDPGASKRQVGIVDTHGRAASWTGEECFTWAGHHTGPNFSCQGNLLVSQDTVDALAEEFQAVQGPLAVRLIAALLAGQAAGGDRRGQQSAALLVVRAGGGYGGYNDRYLDLRVDDAPHPIEELARLLELHCLYFQRTRPEDLLFIDQKLGVEIQTALKAAGWYQGAVDGVYGPTTKAALKNYCLTENLEERWREGEKLDKVVLDYLRGKYRP